MRRFFTIGLPLRAPAFITGIFLALSGCVVDLPDPSEQTFACYTDSDCASGYQCQGPNGTCENLRQQGQNCAGAGDCCERGSICENNTCVPSEQSDRTCVENLGNNSSSGGGQNCAKVWNPGDDCSGDQGGVDCCSDGHSCIDGICQTNKKGLGEPCAGMNECASSHCIDGVCCDKPCLGACRTCNSPDGTDMAGLCSPYQDGVNPNNACGDGNICQNGRCAGCEQEVPEGNACAPMAGICCEQGSYCANDVCAPNGASGDDDDDDDDDDGNNVALAGNCANDSQCDAEQNLKCVPKSGWEDGRQGQCALNSCAVQAAGETCNNGNGFCAQVWYLLGTEISADTNLLCIPCPAECTDGCEYDAEGLYYDNAVTCPGGGGTNLGNGEACDNDGQCLSGTCECADGECAERFCVNDTEDCDPCGWLNAGDKVCYRVNEGVQTPHCNTTHACDGDGQGNDSCKLADGGTCTDDNACLSGNCECANNDCSNKVCAASACPSCKFISDEQGNCDGALDNDLADPVHDCGNLTCNGLGACHLADAEDCNAHEECESNFCECADENCDTKRCSPQACGCQYNADGDTSCEASLTNGKEVAGQCEDTNACYAGSCKLKVGQACDADANCGTGYCECVADDCGVAPGERQCQATDCGPCGYFDAGTNACQPLGPGHHHPEECTYSEHQACNGETTEASACRLYSGKDGCLTDADCLSNNCAFGRCCSSSCNAACETCIENDGNTCSAAPFDNTATNPCAENGYICDGAVTGCSTACTEDTECADGYLCEQVSNACVLERAWTALGPDLNDYNFGINGGSMYNDGAHPQLILNSELPVLAYDIQTNSTDTKRALVFEWNDVIGSDPDNYWTKPQNDDLSQCTASVNLGENCDVSAGTCCQKGTSCESGTCQLLCICQDNGSCDHDGSCAVGAQGTNQPQAYEPVLVNVDAQGSSGFFYGYRRKITTADVTNCEQWECFHKIVIYHNTHTGGAPINNLLVSLPENDLDKYLSGPALALSWTADAGGSFVQMPVGAWFFGAEAAGTKTLNVKHRIYGDHDGDGSGGTADQWFFAESSICDTGAGSASGQGLGQSTSTHPPATSYNTDGEVLLAWIDATDGYVHLSQFEAPQSGPWCWKTIGAMNSAGSADPSVAYRTSGTDFIQTIAHTDTGTNTIHVTYYHAPEPSWAQLGLQTPAQVINQPGWEYSKPKLRRDMANDEGAILAFIAKGVVGEATSATRQAYMLYYHPTENKWHEITATPRSISDRGLGYDTITQEVCDLDVATSAEQICLTTQEQAQGEDCDGSSTTHVYVQCLPWGALP